MKKIPFILIAIAILLPIASLYCLRQIQRDNNFAQSIGVDLTQQEIVFQENPANAIYDEYYLKAVLSADRTKKIRLQLGSKPRPEFSSSVDPSDMASLTSNREWNLSHIKKYVGGRFDAIVDSRTYHCMYLLDIGNSQKQTLYLYGVYSAQ